MDEYATEGQKFSHVCTTGSWTVPAHGSLFTGTYPSEHGVHANNRYLSINSNGTIAEQLSEAGYRTVGFSANPWITPEFGFVDGFDEFYEIQQTVPFEDAGDPRAFFRNRTFDSRTDRLRKIARWVGQDNTSGRLVNLLYRKFKNSHPVPTAEMVNSRIIEWRDSYEREKPFFMFINYMDVHEPYRVHDQYVDADVERDIDMHDIEWNLDSLGQEDINQVTADRVNQIYNASVTYLDTNLEDLFSELKYLDEINDTVVVITSDHGQSLGENQYWGHGTFLYDDLVEVPLIVSAPDSLLDAWPERTTPLSLGEVPFYLMNTIDESFDSLASTLETSAQKKLNGESAPILAESHGPHEVGDHALDGVSKEGYRAIYSGEYRIVRNLEEDSSEVSALGSASIEDRERVRSRLEKHESEFVASLNNIHGGESNTGIETGTKERLADLGYM
jgi:arylsulfatase A-like enzyme